MRQLYTSRLEYASSGVWKRFLRRNEDVEDDDDDAVEKQKKKRNKMLFCFRINGLG